MAAPKKALIGTVPKHLRYLGPESALLQWEFEAPRDAAQDADRLEELRRKEEREFSADPAEFEGPIQVCTRCRRDYATPGRLRCDVCRSRHRDYMRVWRSAPWRRSHENAMKSYHRELDVEGYRARARAKTRAARVVRERDAEIERSGAADSSRRRGRGNAALQGGGVDVGRLHGPFAKW